jgi:hypothetical protein
MGLLASCGGSGSSTGGPPDGGRDATSPLDAGLDSPLTADAVADGPGGSDSPSGVDGGVDGGDTGTSPPPDAASDADDGAPSTVYPAPHPPLPTLTNAAGGPVLTAPRIHLIVYPGDPNQTALTTFAQQLSASTYWAATTKEYGVGALSYGDTTVLTGQTAPGMITSAKIQTWMAQELASGALGTPDPQTIYTILYPSMTMIQQPNPVSSVFGPVNSCTNFTGFHDNVSVALTDGGTPVSFAYAVLATCSTSADALTAVASHEWVEASTDPIVTANGVFTLSGGPQSAYFSVDGDHVVWNVVSFGGEAADLCQPERPEAITMLPGVSNAVQRTWSNALAAASHDPCAPDLAGLPFFDSAPVLDETVTFTSALTGMITTKGVTIPMGQSRAVEVDLFSDGPTSGPWTVTAEDLLAKLFPTYATPTLTFQWDRTQGVNGEKLHLTITVTGASLIGTAHAFVITSTLGTRHFEWPGVVVE